MLAAVALQRLNLELLTYEIIEVGAAPVAGKMGYGNEALKTAAIDHQPSAYFADSLDLHRVALGQKALELCPAAVKLVAPAAEKELCLLALAYVNDLDLDLVAGLGLIRVLYQNPVRPLLSGKQALALEPYIDQPAVFGILDYGTRPDVALAKTSGAVDILIQHILHRFLLLSDSSLSLALCRLVHVHFLIHNQNPP